MPSSDWAAAGLGIRLRTALAGAQDARYMCACIVLLQWRTIAAMRAEERIRSIETCAKNSVGEHSLALELAVLHSCLMLTASANGAMIAVSLTAQGAPTAARVVTLLNSAAQGRIPSQIAFRAALRGLGALDLTALWGNTVAFGDALGIAPDNIRILREDVLQDYAEQRS